VQAKQRQITAQATAIGKEFADRQRPVTIGQHCSVRQIGQRFDPGAQIGCANIGDRAPPFTLRPSCK